MATLYWEEGRKMPLGMALQVADCPSMYTEAAKAAAVAILADVVREFVKIVESQKEKA